MAKFYIYLAVIALAIFVNNGSVAAQSPEDAELVESVPNKLEGFSKFCKMYSHLQLCKIEHNLEVALAELYYIVYGEVAPGSVMLDSVPAPRKRKSAFVRFGKRSLPEDNQEMAFEKRKSAFVRFGRSMDEYFNNGQKRKSSYVRFG